MAEISGFHNSVNGDRRVKSDFFARFFGSLIGNGVFPNPSTGLQVIANGDMTVTVKAGKGWINGVYYENTTDMALSLDVADGVLKRIDRVVLQYSTIDRTIAAKVKKGTFASSPVAPVLQRDSDVWELGIADVYIGVGTTVISQSNITDLRLSDDYCGLVIGLIDHIDGETLFIQFQAIFDDFMESLEGVLDENAAGNLLNLINDLVSKTGSITSLTTTEKSNLVGAINELVAGIDDIESDLSVHTTAISDNAQDIESQALELDNHEVLKAGASVLGHVKTDSVDGDGNLVFNYGRYQADFGLDDAVLTGCFEKDGKVKLSNEWGTTSANVGPGNSGTSQIAQYYGIRLNMTTLAGKLPKIFYLYQGSTSYAKPEVRLKNITTGEAGEWHESTTSTANSTYEFTASEIGYTSGDLIEIQLKCSSAVYTQYTTSSTITYISGKYAYTDDSFETLTTTPNYYPYFSAMCYNVIPNTSGTVIKTVAPNDLIKWGNVKWTQEVPAGSNVVCDILDENNNVLKSGVASIADFSDINVANYQTLKVRWGLSRTDISVKPSVSAASVTWEGTGIPLTGELSDGKILSILDGKPVWADGAKIVSGTYTGDGTTDRMINLGFTPKAIFLSNPTYTYMRGTASNSGQRFNGSAVSNWTETQYCPNIVENGFLIGGANASLTNQTGIVFAYTAIG